MEKHPYDKTVIHMSSKYLADGRIGLRIVCEAQSGDTQELHFIVPDDVAGEAGYKLYEGSNYGYEYRVGSDD